MTTATLTATIHDTGMAELTSISQMSLMLDSICKEATANTNTKTDDDEIAHTMGTAKGLFTKGRDMGIVGETYGQTYLLTQHHSQRHNAFPRKIRSVLDTPRHRAGTGRTDTDGTNRLITAILFHQHHDFLTKGRHELLYHRVVLGIKGIFRQYITTDVNKCIRCTLVADINAYDLRFDVVLFHFLEIVC